jgi:hypothetical protein
LEAQQRELKPIKKEKELFSSQKYSKFNNNVGTQIA